MSWKVKKHYFSRIVFATIYAIAFGVYLFIGTQTRPDVDASSEDRLTISAINLSTPVANLSRSNNTLTAPENIPGAYAENLHKTLLIGHSSTIFSNLKNLKINDEITFDDNTYIIENLETLEKSNIDMDAIVATPTDGRDYLVLMTCAGTPTDISAQDYTHRLIITAVKR